jgi:hypothetical protein
MPPTRYGPHFLRNPSTCTSTYHHTLLTPAGVLTGLIYGMIRHIYRLTSDPVDCCQYLSKCSPVCNTEATQSKHHSHSSKQALTINSNHLDHLRKGPTPQITPFSYISPSILPTHHRARSKRPSTTSSSSTHELRPLSHRFEICMKAPLAK